MAQSLFPLDAADQGKFPWFLEVKWKDCPIFWPKGQENLLTFAKCACYNFFIKVFLLIRKVFLKVKNING